MALSLYDQLYFYVDGILLVEAQQIEYTLTGENQTVLTIVKGFGGITPGPKMTQITFTSAVSSIQAVEAGIDEAFLTSREVEAKLQLGSGKSFISRGFFMNEVRIAGGVGQTTTLNGTFQGTPAILE